MLQRCASVREALQNDALNLFCKHGSNALKNGKLLDDTKNNRRAENNAKTLKTSENAALAAKLGADRAENEARQDPEK